MFYVKCHELEQEPACLSEPRVPAHSIPPHFYSSEVKSVPYLKTHAPILEGAKGDFARAKGARSTQVNVANHFITALRS